MSNFREYLTEGTSINKIPSKNLDTFVYTISRTIKELIDGNLHIYDVKPNTDDINKAISSKKTPGGFGKPFSDKIKNSEEDDCFVINYHNIVKAEFKIVNEEVQICSLEWIFMKN